MQPPASQVVVDRDEDQDQYEESAGLIVKEQADEKQIGVAQEDLVLQQAEQGKHNGKESPEMEMGEQEGMALVENEQALQEVQQYLGYIRHLNNL
jgi:hypothetical protein